MNKSLEAAARASIKLGLSQCTEDEIHLFKRMYSHNNLELPIDDVVDNMVGYKLNTAMSQVEKTLAKKVNK